MRGLKFLLLAAALLAPLALVPRANAQVTINIGAPPVCSYGYYGYAPYACAPTATMDRDTFTMASSWEMDRGKTGATTTVGEAIASTVQEAATITPDMDIPVVEVPPTRMGARPFTAPDRRTTDLTPQLCIPTVKPRTATAATAKRSTVAAVNRTKVVVVVSATSRYR